MEWWSVATKNVTFDDSNGIVTGTVDLGPCLTGSSDPGAEAGVAATKSSAKPRILALI
jgi:hypothetical protein